MKIALLSSIAWRTPPRHYGPWEQVVSLLTEGLVKRGIDVTLFATADSQTSGKLHSICPGPYEEDKSLEPKVWECLHISELFEQADKFDLIHNHFDFLPLTYSDLIDTPVVCTIHGFSSLEILPVYKKYNGRVYYVSISEADRHAELDYIATVYHGIDIKQFTFEESAGKHLLFFGRIHHDKGAKEAIEIAKRSGMKLVMAGVIQEQAYYEAEMKPYVDGDRIKFMGSVGPKLRDWLMGNAYALIHPINFAEPFGLSVVESMACGTPTVAFRKGSLPELIFNGENGFLVDDIEEAVQSLKRIPEIQRRRCRKIAEERFSADRMVDEYIKVYESVLSQCKREDRRPWGFYEVLSDSPDHKVKRITVYPKTRLSLQRHQRRSEHWHIVHGNAMVTLDSQEIRLGQGDSVDIPQGAAHRIANSGNENLVFIEVQRGEYFGEDDIERLEDDYGRV